VVKKLKRYKTLEDIKKQVLAYVGNEKSSLGIFK